MTRLSLFLHQNSLQLLENDLGFLLVKIHHWLNTKQTHVFNEG